MTKKMNNKGRSSGTSFAGVPRRVMEHTDYINLSPKAKVLLLEAAYQYKGKNNGDLTFAWSIMKQRGFNSQTTLQSAIRELIQANLILKTREGLFQNPKSRCALYALTWQNINDCFGKNLDYKATITPIRKFSVEAHTKKNNPLQKVERLDPKSGAVVVEN